jgi:hypothetical protein
MEYAFFRSNELHFATASFVSKYWCDTAPILVKLWFAADRSASPSSAFAEFDEAVTQETDGIISFD